MYFFQITVGVGNGGYWKESDWIMIPGARKEPGSSLNFKTHAFIVLLSHFKDLKKSAIYMLWNLDIVLMPISIETKERQVRCLQMRQLSLRETLTGSRTLTET